MPEKNRKKRPVVAFFCGNYHSDHSSRIVEYIYRLMQDADLDVRYYLATESSSLIDAIHLEGNRFDYQYASLPGYSAQDDPDIMIISYGTIVIYQHFESLQFFLDHVPHVPAVVMEYETDIKGCVSVGINNEKGMREIVEHMLKVHHVKRPAFLCGPGNNEEARIRRQTFQDVCRENGIEVPESRYVQGDFSMTIDSLIEDLLDREPDIDAIISANDEMAVSAERVLLKRGLVPGRDVLVSGFDNASFCDSLPVPLSTVEQNYDIMMQETTASAFALLHREDIKAKKLEPRMVIRSSCGCHPEKTDLRRQPPEPEKKKQVRVLQDSKSWSSALLLREILIQSGSMKTFFQTLGEKLSAMGCLFSWISLLDPPQEILPPQENQSKVRVRLVEHPENAKLVMLQVQDRVTALELSDAKKIEGIPQEISDFDGKPHQSFTFLLYYQQIQYGTFTVCCLPSEIAYYYSMSLEIGTGIMVHHLLNKEKQLVKVLRDKNQALDFEAEHDVLTGCYNRGSLIQRMLDMVHKSEHTRFAALMGDLDRLKQINDTFGHIEGDFAIRKAAAFLRDALPERTLIGRIGGDEFLCFFPVDETDPKEVLARLDLLEKNFDEVSTKPYYIEVSAGYTLFEEKDVEDVQEIVRMADASLYAAKKNRRRSVVREVPSHSCEGCE